MNGGKVLSMNDFLGFLLAVVLGVGFGLLFDKYLTQLDNKGKKGKK